jgi:energy-coupling factor transporter transmembrane protein EcfT
MTSDENSRELDKAVKAIAAVIGLMIAVFALLGIFLPTSLTQPIGALIIGLIFTAILVWMGKLEWGRALVTWLVVSIGVIILYLIVSRPASIVGSVVDSSGSPVKGLTLILTDANGVDHKTISDENGAFEINNVSEGKFNRLVAQ